MIINLDKFFVEELEKAGYSDLDYSKLVALYRASRENPQCILRRERYMRQKMKEEEWLRKMEEQYGPIF